MRSIPQWIAGLLALSLVAACATAGLVDRGDRLVKEQQWDEAIKAYSKAVAADPKDARVQGKLDNARRGAAAHYHVAGRKAEEARDLNGALAAYDKAVGFQADHAAARTDRSKVKRLRTVTERDLRRVERQLAKGDCLGAKAGFERLYPWKPTFPEIDTGRVASLKRCFDNSLAVAKVFMALGDPEAAEPFLKESETYYPKHPEVARLRAEAGGAQAAANKIAEGHGHLIDKRYADAAKAYRDGLARDATRADARDALVKATNLEVDSRIKSAARDLKRGRWQKVLADLEGALAVGPPDLQVRQRLNAAATDLRKKAAASLYKLGLRADGAGLFGAAWVWFRLCGLIGRPFADADLKARLALGRVNEAVPYRVLVTPVAHETELGGLAAEITQELLDVLQKDLNTAGAKVTLTTDPNVQPPPDGILRGRLSEFLIPPPAVRQQPRQISWQPPAKVSTNPKAGAALKAYVDAVAGGDQAKIDGALDVLKATGGTQREIGATEQISLAAMTVAWKATGGAEMELYDRANDRVVTAAYSDVQTTFEDTAAAGAPAADIEADALHALSPAALRRRVVIDLVEDMRTQLSPALSMSGLRFQRLADRVKGDARLHYIVLALVAGTPDAEAMREELLNATGYKFGEDKYDPSKLPL